MDQSVPPHCRDRLARGNALFAALVRLSLRRRKGVGPGRDLQNHERRLLRIIINPAMAATWLLGLWLAWHGPDSRYGWFASGWLSTKLALVVALSALHGACARWVKDFAADRNRHSQKFYRIINEIPAILMAVIVILAVMKPF